MQPLDTKFDPWGPVSTVLYEINNSDFVQDAIGNTGVDVQWRAFTVEEAYSHGTRIRALRRDISAAYARLDTEQRGQFAQIIVKAILRHHKREELKAKLVERLKDIGWTISDRALLITEDALISEQFFPANSPYDAYLAIRDVLSMAKSNIVVVDPYVGSSLLMTIKALHVHAISVKILTVEKHLKADFRIEAAAFRRQLQNVDIELRSAPDFHDRFIMIDDTEIYHVGASIKDAGSRAFMINHIQDRPNQEKIRRAIDDSWLNATAIVI